MGVKPDLKLIISDIRLIRSVPLLFLTLLAPVIIVLLLLFIYPLIGALISEDAFVYGRIYSLTAITLISSVPIVYGLLLSHIHTTDPYLQADNGDSAQGGSRERALLRRMAFSTSLSLITVLPAIYLTGPVSTEGWLRAIFAAILVSLNTPFIYLFSASALTKKRCKLVFPLILVALLITVPLGLLFHHPWSYFLFYSPFYWVSWAWVVGSPSESLIFGIISMAIAGAGTVISWHYVSRGSKAA